MSRENVEAIQTAYEAWNRGDFEEVFAILDPEIKWQLPASKARSRSGKTSNRTALAPRIVHRYAGPI
jgi:ketosteroid isomerase-like protein